MARTRGVYWEAWVRLDPAMREAVGDLANRDERTINAMIKLLLREALEARGITVPRQVPADKRRQLADAARRRAG